MTSQNFASLPVTNMDSPGTNCTKRQIPVFITERYSLKNSANQAKNRDWSDGMGLVKRTNVRRGLTYRSILLAAGIGVALIVLLTLWASRKEAPLAFGKPIGAVVVEASDLSLFKILSGKNSEIKF